MHLYYSSGQRGSERIMKLELRNRRQRVGLYFVREWIIHTERANESSKPCYRNGAVDFAMGCAGYCSIVSIEADPVDCAGAAGRRRGFCRAQLCIAVERSVRPADCGR